jgi:NTE family protein
MEEHRADGVFQGGGVKGLALAGGLVEFANREKHPQNYIDDWVQLAGTSAGAIVAAYLACGHDAAATEKLIEETDFSKFEDWGRGGEFFGGAINLAKHHGLAHGEVFREWFREQIDDQKFSDVAAAKRKLKLIATDITRREMLVLPNALSEYSLTEGGPAIDPMSFAVADAVRMSMSIPFFFQPVQLFHAQTGASTIIDGGVLSNFPVWIFDAEDHDPQRPTFGFKLIGGRAAGAGLERILKALGWPVAMGMDIFHTTTDAWDKYWVRHSTYVRTCAISAGDIGTTQFDLDATQKRELIGWGERDADEFLKKWKPEDYVNSHDRTLA